MSPLTCPACHLGMHTVFENIYYEEVSHEQKYSPTKQCYERHYGPPIQPTVLLECCECHSTIGEGYLEQNDQYTLNEFWQDNNQ